MHGFVPPAPPRAHPTVLSAPPSKSVTHRALVAAALAAGRSRLHSPLVSEDTEATRRGLRALGIEVETSGAHWWVQGTAGAIEGGATVDAGASGTTLRLLTAVAALGRRPSRLGGVPRLAIRPVDPLLEALRALGAHAERLPAAEGEPFLEAGGRPFRGGPVSVDAAASSQFASALLLVGPVLSEGMDLSLRGDAVSLPYLGLTVEMLARFGVTVEAFPPRFRVRPSSLLGTEIEIEGDWSSAAYLLTGAAIAGGSVTVEGVRLDSRQADVAVVSLLRACGAHVEGSAQAVSLRGTGSIGALDVDLRHSPDLAPTAAVLALFSEGRSVLRGLAQLRGKESDRLQAMAEGLRALGRSVQVAPGTLVVEPPARALGGARIRTHGDHRIAMAFALAGLRLPGVEVDDPACVAKSYPTFWRDLSALRTGTRAPPTSRRGRCPWSCRSHSIRTVLPGCCSEY
jgi:3-phosphoshikimate 1-carboxyvinyltransferase